MTRAACTKPQELLEYWLGELDQARESRLDEHLFACAACSERLRALVDLGAAIRGEILRGSFGFVVPASHVRKFKDGGLRVREYSLEPGGSVDCTITPDDDLVVAYLRAGLRDVRRLDVLVDDDTAGFHRANDVAFDPSADGLALVPSAAFLRTLGHSRPRVRLVAVDGENERVLGDYSFNHHPS